MGVESNSRRYYFLEKLRRANNSKFRIVNMSIFDYIGNEPHEIDVALALSIFHWFIRTKENFRQLERLLTNIRTRELYFSPHSPYDENMRGAYCKPAEDDFADFVMTRAGLRTMRCIGHLGRADSNRAV